MNKQEIEEQMKQRLANNLDPLTGEEMETVGKIVRTNKGCFDETGKEATLNDKGSWIYK